MEVVIFPDAGRIGRIAFPMSGNLLRLDTNLLAEAASPGEGWKNFGGDWLWPVRQERWKEIVGADWPPPPLLEQRPWTATAWMDVAGRACCLMTNYYGPPVNLAVSRLVRVDTTEARITIDQRAVRTAKSDIPAALWHITQVGSAEEAVLAATTNSLSVLGFTPPPPEIMTACTDAVAIQVSAGTEHKIGSDVAPGWIAARRGDWLIVAKAQGGDRGGSTELYANRGLGYTEIETTTRERLLKPGESISNVLTLEVYHLPRPLSGCDLIDWMRARRNPDQASGAGR